LFPEKSSFYKTLLPFSGMRVRNPWRRAVLQKEMTF